MILHLSHLSSPYFSSAVNTIVRPSGLSARDGAAVPLGDAARDGQADAEAAGLGAAGGVCAVKAVKEPAERGRVERIAPVFHADHNTAPPLSSEKEMDVSGAAYLTALSSRMDTSCRMAYLRRRSRSAPASRAHQARVRRDTAKSRNDSAASRKRVADREVRHLQRRTSSSMRESVTRALTSSVSFFGLVFRLVNPLLLPDLHLQHLQARGDDG